MRSNTFFICCEVLQVQDCRQLKDTYSGGGGDRQDGANGDGLLSILQVTRAIGASHDTYDVHKKIQHYTENLFITENSLTNVKKINKYCLQKA